MQEPSSSSSCQVLGRGRSSASALVAGRSQACVVLVMALVGCACWPGAQSHRRAGLPADPEEGREAAASPLGAGLDLAERPPELDVGAAVDRASRRGALGVRLAEDNALHAGLHGGLVALFEAVPRTRGADRAALSAARELLEHSRRRLSAPAACAAPLPVQATRLDPGVAGEVMEAVLRRIEEPIAIGRGPNHEVGGVLVVEAVAFAEEVLDGDAAQADLRYPLVADLHLLWSLHLGAWRAWVSIHGLEHAFTSCTLGDTRALEVP